MAFWSLRFVSVLVVLTLLVLFVDALTRARMAWERRKRAQGGVFGVVIDAHGRIIATYVNPMQEPRRSGRMHGPGSVWTGSDASEPGSWAWEGQAETLEDALHVANRIRHLHVSLIPELQEIRDPHGPDDERDEVPWR